MTQSTDARGVKTTFAEFDMLNRVKRITFNDGTPQVTYSYDQARTGFFNNGFVTRIETAEGDPVLRPNTPATFTEFDYNQMGLVANHRQSVDSQVYALEYGYNLSGQLPTMKYPVLYRRTMMQTVGKPKSPTQQERTLVGRSIWV